MIKGRTWKLRQNRSLSGGWEKVASSLGHESLTEFLSIYYQRGIFTINKQFATKEYTNDEDAVDSTRASVLQILESK